MLYDDSIDRNIVIDYDSGEKSLCQEEKPLDGINEWYGCYEQATPFWKRPCLNAAIANVITVTAIIAPIYLLVCLLGALELGAEFLASIFGSLSQSVRRMAGCPIE